VTARGRGTGEPAPGWRESVAVVEGMGYGAAVYAVEELGGTVTEPRAGSGGFVTFSHALLPGVRFWRSARQLEADARRWAAPESAVAWLGELLEVLWSRERGGAA
jgi:hypothetical protein